MSRRTDESSKLFAAISVLLLSGCAAQTITSALPAIDSPGEPTRVSGLPAEVYSLIARGATSCWFAAGGQLKATHIFHADVDPPARGGGVEIAIHERDIKGEKPWGVKAFRINLIGSGEQTNIVVENLKVPEPIAALMRADVFHWVTGGRDCKLKPVEIAAPPPPPLAKSKKKTSPKS